MRVKPRNSCAPGWAELMNTTTIRGWSLRKQPLCVWPFILKGELQPNFKRQAWELTCITVRYSIKRYGGKGFYWAIGPYYLLVSPASVVPATYFSWIVQLISISLGVSFQILKIYACFRRFVCLKAWVFGGTPTDRSLLLFKGHSLLKPCFT